MHLFNETAELLLLLTPLLEMSSPTTPRSRIVTLLKTKAQTSD